MTEVYRRASPRSHALYGLLRRGCAGPERQILDPEERILLVHRWSRDGYVVVQRATSGETVRAEPFDAIELAVSELFGDDDA